MKQVLLWLYWCWKFKEFMPWCVSYVSTRNLTYDEYYDPRLDEICYDCSE